MSDEKRVQQIRYAARYKYPDERIHFIDGAKWADSHPHWIPVEERLPEVGEPVLFFTPSMDEPLKGAYQKNGTWWSVEYECKFINGITYWMPLPEAPRKEDKK